VKKVDLRKSDPQEVEQFLVGQGEKPFRGKQIQEWLWKKSAHSIDEMTNLSLETRELLKSRFTINPVTVEQKQVSEDQTVKFKFALWDNHYIEGVLIPADNRLTACVSSQVGCSLSCKFCATGYMDKKRNLDSGEIYDQIVYLRNQAETGFDSPLTNIVYMGMGEPLLNYSNVLGSITRITSPEGLNMSPRRITVSTAGIAKMIKRLGDDEVKFNLALSLHAANDEKRHQIMPINDTNNIKILTEALQYFYSKTKNRLTLEYILFENFNDTLEDAEELFQITKKVPSKINLIEYNPIAEVQFRTPDPHKVDAFANYLEERKVVVNVRRSRGKDIDAACGQLANKG